MDRQEVFLWMLAVATFHYNPQKMANGLFNKFAFMVFATNICIVLINCLLLFDTDLFKVFTIVSDSSDCRKQLLQKIKNKNIKAITAWEWLLVIVGYIIEPIFEIVLIVIAIKKAYGG